MASVVAMEGEEGVVSSSGEVRARPGHDMHYSAHFPLSRSGSTAPPNGHRGEKGGPPA